MINRMNWPMHCKRHIQFERVKINIGHVDKRGWSVKAHEVEYSCTVCRMRGSFDDFATDERLRQMRWA